MDNFIPIKIYCETHKGEQLKILSTSFVTPSTGLEIRVEECEKCEDERDSPEESYQDGYDAGYKEAENTYAVDEDAIRADGYADGHEIGYAEGFSEGMRQAHEEQSV
tara:strand:+ start:2414 stop:2734 length:321 start_codon:yes stop_codon:yes gene_type:complete